MSIASRSPRRAHGLRVAGVFTVVTLALGACGKSEADATKAEDPVLTVGRESVYRVEPTRLSSGPSISGSLEAERQATVAAEVAGPVLATAAEEGDSVSAGALLARLDDSALRESVLSAQSAVRSAEGQVEVARRNAERAEALLKGGAIPERDVEAARWSVTNAEAGLADARARLTYAREQLAKTLVRAPFRGVVSEKSVSPGDTVQAGSPLYTLIDPLRMRLVAHVPAEGIATLRVGTPVEFVVAGLVGQRFSGSVQRINPMADPSTRQVQIQVALPNPEGRLVAGLFAEGRVTSAARQALAVPAAAVDRSLGQPALLRVRGGQVERVAVRLGITDEEAEKVEVVSGVEAGDLVLLGAARGIAPGAKVTVQGEAANSGASPESGSGNSVAVGG